MEDIPTVTDLEYAVQVLIEERDFCLEPPTPDTEGAAMLTRVISVLTEVQKPLGEFAEAMAQGMSPMAFMVQWAASQNSDKAAT